MTNYELQELQQEAELALLKLIKENVDANKAWNENLGKLCKAYADVRTNPRPASYEAASK